MERSKISEKRATVTKQVISIGYLINKACSSSNSGLAILRYRGSRLYVRSKIDAYSLIGKRGCVMR